MRRKQRDVPVVEAARDPGGIGGAGVRAWHSGDAGVCARIPAARQMSVRGIPVDRRPCPPRRGSSSQNHDKVTAGGSSAAPLPQPWRPQLPGRPRHHRTPASRTAAAPAPGSV